MRNKSIIKSKLTALEIKNYCISDNCVIKQKSLITNDTNFLKLQTRGNSKARISSKRQIRMLLKNERDDDTELSLRTTR